MSGRIFLSLDCEGMWGVCDVAGPSVANITHANLLKTYQRLAGMLAAEKAGATFAITGLFVLSPRAYEKYMPYLSAHAEESAGWYPVVLQRWQERGGDGFHLPELTDLIDAVPRANVSQHGLTHLPAGPGVSEPLLEHEYVSAANILRRFRNFNGGIIFPRNALAPERILRRSGITWYRDSREAKMSRYWRTARRFIPSTYVADKAWHKSGDGIEAVFGGNIPFFPDRLPRILSEQYIDHLVQHVVTCAKAGHTAHIWLHPENLIGRPVLFSLIERLLSAAKCGVDGSLVSAIMPCDLGDPA